jgi:NAD(P)H-dependent flavin oxidoreductase YrpB (nitropropane dioxygenase family)
MITTRLTSRFGLSMPILLAPMDTVSDARQATTATRASGRGVLDAGYVAADLVTHTRAELCESVESQIIRVSDLGHQTLRKRAYTW